MADAPHNRIWPPVALGVPLAAGLAVSSALGDPVRLPLTVRPAGWALAAFSR